MMMMMMMTLADFFDIMLLLFLFYFLNCLSIFLRLAALTQVSISFNYAPLAMHANRGASISIIGVSFYQWKHAIFWFLWSQNMFWTNSSEFLTNFLSFICCWFRSVFLIYSFKQVQNINQSQVILFLDHFLLSIYLHRSHANLFKWKLSTWSVVLNSKTSLSDAS